MHKFLTHSKYWSDYRAYAHLVLQFLLESVPRIWLIGGAITDNFRAIKPNEFRVLT